tara:strand:- start:29 stop:253 length:225 start_codon:yes stop_codon:yes gene_type:complete
MILREELYNIYVKTEGMKRFKRMDLSMIDEMLPSRMALRSEYAKGFGNVEAYEILLSLRFGNPKTEFKKVKVKA